MIRSFLEMLVDKVKKSPRRVTEKPVTRYTYVEGPMKYLAQHIVRRMQDHGWPCTIYYLHRSPELQLELYQRRPRVTRAKPFDSPHQFFCAADIVHADLFWQAPKKFWDDLNVVVRQVSEEFGVELDHGHTWSFVDSAHIELGAWRDFRSRIGRVTPNQAQLDQLFEDLLPKVWKQHKQSVAYANR